MSLVQPEQNRAIACTLLAVDRQRSPLHAITAAQQQALAFSAYGTCNPQDTPLTTLGFTGEQRITSTGHYLLGNGYRAFNPVLMRFNGPDKLSPFGKGGLNSYAYCAGDPVNRVDPAGTIWNWLKPALRALRIIKRSKPRPPQPLGAEVGGRMRYNPPARPTILPPDYIPPLAAPAPNSTSSIDDLDGFVRRTFFEKVSPATRTVSVHVGTQPSDWGWDFMGAYARRVGGTSPNFVRRRAASIRSGTSSLSMD